MVNGDLQDYKAAHIAEMRSRLARMKDTEVERRKFVEDHRLEMRRRLKDLIAYDRRLRRQDDRYVIIEAKRKLQAALMPRVIPPEVREIIQRVCNKHKVRFDDVVHSSKSRAANAARLESLEEIYKTFPGKPWRWYAQPFGYRQTASPRELLIARGIVDRQEWLDRKKGKSS